MCGIVKSGPAPAVVPDRVIADIRKRERDGVIELRRLQAGSRVRIVSGPFRNQLGLCASMNGAQRVIVARPVRLASYVPGELIRVPLSGSIPELPHVAKRF